MSDKNKGGRPPKPMPEPIPDTPENVARAIMQGPPKERWRFEEGSRRQACLGAHGGGNERKREDEKA